MNPVGLIGLGLMGEPMALNLLGSDTPIRKSSPMGISHGSSSLKLVRAVFHHWPITTGRAGLNRT